MKECFIFGDKSTRSGREGRVLTWSEGGEIGTVKEKCLKISSKSSSTSFFSFTKGCSGRGGEKIVLILGCGEKEERDSSITGERREKVMVGGATF